MSKKGKRKGQRGNPRIPATPYRLDVIGRVVELGGLGRNELCATLVRQFEKERRLTERQWRTLEQMAEKWGRRKANSGAPYSIYAIRAGQFVKIGYSRNVGGRLEAIQTGNPDHCRVIGKWPVGLHEDAARLAEARLHDLLRDSRHRGEWFHAEAVERLIDVYGDHLLSLDDHLRLNMDADRALS